MAIANRKVFSIAEKVEIIRQIEMGRSQSDISRELSIAKATISTIWTKRKKTIDAFHENLSTAKKLRKPLRCDIDEALLKWFNVQRIRNLPISGPILRAKAEELARLFGDEEFTCSNGWIDRFKTRHKICFAKLSGKPEIVAPSSTKDWLQQWSHIREGYCDENIFNADEMGLYYKLTPNETPKFINEKCIGGELSKDRITVLVCANMTGTEKRELLVIGKSKHPGCLTNTKAFPVLYEANQHAWMTSDIFQATLRQWDKQLGDRKILLLIDTCPAHSHVKYLKNIMLIYLPASVLQPMDQGIIRSLKCHFRKLFLFQIIQHADNGTKFSPTILDAISMLAKAWNRVTSTVIRNCFMQAGLSRTISKMLVSDVDVLDNEDDLPLSEWIRSKNSSGYFEGVTAAELDMYSSVDDDVIIAEDPTDAGIFNSMKSSQEDEEMKEEILLNEQEAIPTIHDALKAFNTLSKFVERHDIPDTSLNTLENVLEEMFWHSKKQL